MLLTSIARRTRSINRAVSTARFSSGIAVPAFQQQQQQQNAKDYSFAATFGLAMLLTVGISASESSKKSTSTDAAEKKWPVISRKEVQFHNCLDRDIWVTYKDSVYDITDFVYNHPGGKGNLEGVAGQDIGEAWNLFRNHRSSPLAHQLLEDMKIGQLAPSEVIHVPEPKHTPVYSTDPVYDVIIVGAGLSGLQCGSALVNSYGVDKSKILVLEAQDYVGGRVKQMTEFIKGAKIEVGAEFLHGNNTELTKFARANDEPLREIYCWAHGDGGPLPEPADNGYGLYYVGANKKHDGNAPPAIGAAGDVTNLPYTPSATDVALNSRNRLLRYDDKDADFVALNQALWDLCDLNENDFDESLSLYDYLISKKLNPNMLKMGAAGFSNTLCSNSNELSLKQAVKWSRIWHNEGEEDEEDGDYTFKNSYSSLIDHLRKDLQIELNTPIAHIAYETLPEPAPAGVEAAAPVTAAAGVCQCVAAGQCTCKGACSQCACSKAVPVTTADAGAAAGCCKPAATVESETKCSAEKKCASKCAAKAADNAAVVCHKGCKSTSAATDAPDTLVTITTKDGAVYRAKKILVTASPHVINNKLITFSPALPTEVSDAFSYTLMNPVIKVIMKFTKPCWPQDLHGMIMVDDDFLLPEVWFRHVPEEIAEGEPATAYAVGFTTAKYTEKIESLSQKEVLEKCVAQLDTIFSQLEQRHMSGEHPEQAARPSTLPKAREVFLGGMYWDWRPSHHPYIGGGYCSPLANKPITSGDTLSKAYANERLFFAGEATNDRPGATAHAALETGLRAARQISAALKDLQ